MKLTAKNVASLTLGDKRDLIIFDEDLPASAIGFGPVPAAGAAIWIAQYRRAGATRRVLLGS